ncbi:hypothetical protein FBU30_006876 [Linnemannia zychae]|nr:hypothetical protein FBU30_006876 [Linnemannia zychae]
MSASRIRNGITASIRVQSTTGAQFEFAQCSHQPHHPSIIPDQVLKWFLTPSTPTLSSITPKTRSFLIQSRFAHSKSASPSASIASKHVVTASKPRESSTKSTSSWDIPVRSTTNRESSHTRTIRGSAVANKFIPIINTSPSSHPNEVESFIPELALQDPTVDYWKTYQQLLNKRQKPNKTELLRLHDWLSTRPLMTVEVATRSNQLIAELHKQNIQFNIDLYNNLLHLHIKRNKFEDAQKVLDQMAQHQKSLYVNGAMRQRTLALLLAMYIKSGNQAQLQTLVNQSSSKSVEIVDGRRRSGRDNELNQTFSEFLAWTKGLQLKNDQISKVKSIFYEIQDRICPPNSPQFTILVQRYFQNNRPLSAYQLMNHILDVGFHPNTFTTSSVMSGLLNARLYDETKYIMNRIWTDSSSCSDTMVLLNSLLSALCKDTKQFSMAVELWNSILADPKIKPDVFTVSHMLNGYFRVKDPSSAMQLWDQMREKPYSIQPNPVMYNSVMSGLFRNHRPNEAMAIFEQMMAQNDIVVPLDTFQIMIKGLLSVKDSDNLVKVFHKMDQLNVDKDDTITYTMITDILFSQRDAEGAKQVIDLMTSRNIPKNAITYSAIIAGLVKVDDFDRAQRIFKEMQEAGHKPTIHTFGAMMQGAFKIGNVDYAESMADLAKTMKGGMTAGAYLIMISGYTNLLMMDKADRWFQEFRHTIPHSSSSSSSSFADPSSLNSGPHLVETFKTVWKIYYVQLKACVENQLWEHAVRILGAMKESGFESTVPRLTKLIWRVEQVRAIHPEFFSQSPSVTSSTTVPSSSRLASMN